MLWVVLTVRVDGRLPGWLSGDESACNAEVTGSIPESGKMSHEVLVISEPVLWSPESPKLPDP